MATLSYGVNGADFGKQSRGKMMKQKVYTVRACRWGDRETHSYVVGVYSKKHAALKAAEIEEEYRGGKYECEVLEWVIDSGMEGRTAAKRGESACRSHKTIRDLPPINQLHNRDAKEEN